MHVVQKSCSTKCIYRWHVQANFDMREKHKEATTPFHVMQGYSRCFKQVVGGMLLLVVKPL